MGERPVLDYGQPEPKKPTHVPTSVFLIVVGFGIALVWWTMTGLTSSPQARQKANQIHCASNLRQIGQAIELYAADNDGQFPPDLQTLASAEPLGLECFICPSSADTRARNPSEFALPGHISYIYVGANLSTQSKPGCIVAFDDPDNHCLTGANVLFGDGHVEFCNLPTIQLFLNDLNSGWNPPPTLVTNASKSSAEKDYQTNWKPRMPQLKSGVWHIPATRPTAARQ